MKTIRLLLPLALLLATAQAVAGTPINETRPLAADGHLDIGNVKGEVNVTAWDQNQVRITGTLGDGVRKLEIEGDAHDLTIKVRGPDSGGLFNWGSDSSMGPTVLNVQVPRGTNLEVHTVSADTSVHGLAGGKLDIGSVSGAVDIDARSPKLSLETVSGNIELAGMFDDADINTVSGDVVAPALGAIAKVETVSGDVRIGGGPFRKLAMNSVSGDMEIRGALADAGNIDVDSMSGDVTLDLPGGLSAKIDASSFSGDLRSDWGSVQEHEHGPGSELKATAGGGNGNVTVETFSGDLRLHKGN
ncbi:MAG TPA: DUF4097 family beta strand repeat-containing protein [Rhodanobacteraceae bacterium]|nr:DUF4097 family beta strand repeat-containing protein [Rhodanobacteraceae bacterium]